MYPPRPSQGRPVLYTRGKLWIVRWYDPIAKQVRAIRTKSEQYARAMHLLFNQGDLP